MGQGLVIAEVYRDAARVTLALLLQGLFEVSVSAAEHQQLPTARHDLVHPAQYQGKALLRGDSTDHRKQRRISLLVKPAVALQRGLTQGLTCKTFGPVAMADMNIFGWVPHRFVHCIENANQLVTPGTQQTVQAAALLRGLDFTGVGRADCAQVIGVVKAGFHERHLAVKFKAVDRKGGGR